MELKVFGGIILDAEYGLSGSALEVHLEVFGSPERGGLKLGIKVLEGCLFDDSWCLSTYTLFTQPVWVALLGSKPIGTSLVQEANQLVQEVHT